MNPKFCAKLKFVHSVFRAGTNDQVAAAERMLEDLVLYGGAISESNRIFSMQFLKQAMYAVCGAYQSGQA